RSSTSSSSSVGVSITTAIGVAPPRCSNRGEAVAALPYLEISSTDEDSGCIDDWLARHGLHRKITHCAPRLSAAEILSSTDLVAVLSRRLGDHWVQTYGFSIRDLPFA